MPRHFVDFHAKNATCLDDPCVAHKKVVFGSRASLRPIIDEAGGGVGEERRGGRKNAAGNDPFYFSRRRDRRND